MSHSFAFQFLLSVFKDLERSQTKTNTAIQRRIWKICQGYLTWISRSKHPGPPESSFVTNYSATGKTIANLGSLASLSNESLVNIPLQTTKISDFDSTFSKLEGHQKHEDQNKMLVKSIVPLWIDDLERADKRHFPAFPRPGTQEYLLKDHIWIWRALESVERLGLTDLLKTKSRQTKDNSMRPDSKRKLGSQRNPAR